MKVLDKPLDHAEGVALQSEGEKKKRKRTPEEWLTFAALKHTQGQVKWERLIEAE